MWMRTNTLEVVSWSHAGSYMLPRRVKPCRWVHGIRASHTGSSPNTLNCPPNQTRAPTPHCKNHWCIALLFNCHSTYCRQMSRFHNLLVAQERGKEYFIRFCHRKQAVVLFIEVIVDKRRTLMCILECLGETVCRSLREESQWFATRVILWTGTSPIYPPRERSQPRI